jgi:hypothetical protein
VQASIPKPAMATLLSLTPFATVPIGSPASLAVPCQDCGPIVAGPFPIRVKPPGF